MEIGGYIKHNFKRGVRKFCISRHHHGLGLVDKGALDCIACEYFGGEEQTAETITIICRLRGSVGGSNIEKLINTILDHAEWSGTSCSRQCDYLVDEEDDLNYICKLFDQDLDITTILNDRYPAERCAECIEMLDGDRN